MIFSPTNLRVIIFAYMMMKIERSVAYGWQNFAVEEVCLDNKP
jgi:hypothetical protein